VRGTAVDEEVRMAKSRKRYDDISSPEPDTVAGSGRNGNDPERIAARAYELYLARGGGDGQAWDDWLAAERELSAPAGAESRK
jgi:DUF2934 family protein